jgi:hypothetical protein
MIGNSQSTAPLVPSAPSGVVSSSAGTSSVLFLGFFKGYTDVPNTSAKVCQCSHRAATVGFPMAEALPSSCAVARRGQLMLRYSAATWLMKYAEMQVLGYAG